MQLSVHLRVFGVTATGVGVGNDRWSDKKCLTQNDMRLSRCQNMSSQRTTFAAGTMPLTWRFAPTWPTWKHAPTWNIQATWPSRTNGPGQTGGIILTAC